MGAAGATIYYIAIQSDSTYKHIIIIYETNRLTAASRQLVRSSKQAMFWCLEVVGSRTESTNDVGQVINQPTPNDG